MTSNRVLLSLFSIVIVASGSIHSDPLCTEPSDCPDTLLLDEIVAIGTRTEIPLLYSPNSTSLVTSDELLEFTGSSLAETLRDVPGVYISDSGQAGMKRLRIRGEESYRVGILVDGQQITDHRRDGVPLTLDPALVERIEVIRGAGSVLYGPKALGGVVNFITRKGGDEPFQGTLSTGYSSATHGVQSLATVYGNYKAIDYRLALTRSDDDDRKTPIGRIDNTSAETDSHSLYLGKQLGDHHLALRWDDHDAYSEVFVEDEVRFSFPFTDFGIDIPQRDRKKLGIFYDWTNVSYFLNKIHVDSYYQVSDRQFDTHWEQGTFGLKSETFSDSQLVTSGTLVQLDWDLADNHDLVTGIQYQLDEEDQERLEILSMSLPKQLTLTNLIADKAQLETLSIFAQDEWHVTDEITLVAGIRQYWVRSELENTNRAGLSPPDGQDNEHILAFAALWEFSADTLFRLSFAQGYMYPSLLQLSMGGVDRTFVNPNPNLSPETSETWELGLRHSSPRFQADLTLFYSESENYIDQVPCTLDTCIGGKSRVPPYIYVNIGEARTVGIEGYTEYRIYPWISVYGSLTFMDREKIFTDFSTRKSGIPQIRGTLGTRINTYILDGSKFWIDSYIRGEEEADELEENGTLHENQGWVSWNLEAGITVGPKDKYNLTLGLYNLTDKLYSYATENLFATGRNIQVKFTLNF